MSEIQEAESKIAEILRDLELETTETTAYGDSRRQLQAKVCIEMFRAPGNNWSV